ncbi:hypothetical protein L596_017419 [Steinernema carpocapsae]|uniref:Uncharacterized protein n=1 Tax=Steinernema carpocapsae TaxID=34508 RepID=A0A4V6A1Q1_STECR|nr:hypothetical protein L596_017419 [Steinernema carpocapsae]
MQFPGSPSELESDPFTTPRRRIPRIVPEGPRHLLNISPDQIADIWRRLELGGPLANPVAPRSPPRVYWHPIPGIPDNFDTISVGMRTPEGTPSEEISAEEIPRFRGIRPRMAGSAEIAPKKRDFLNEHGPVNTFLAVLGFLLVAYVLLTRLV